MKNLLAWFIRQGVPTNLLMLGLLFAGILGGMTITQKVFPELSLDRVEIRVDYPGATPDEVESSIVQPIEEQIGGIEGIREVVGVAAEGQGIVTVELISGEDVRKRLEEIKAEVDRITTFPREAERPEIRELTNRHRVIELVVHGAADEASLRELAYQVKSDLVLQPEISFVEVVGVRDYEVAIEFSSERLRELGLSLTEVADRVGAASLELPAGRLVTADGEIRVRTLGRNFDRRDFERLPLIARPDGTQIQLGDVAVVRDGFRDLDLVTRFNGQPAAIVRVYRIGDEQVLRLVDAVEHYVNEELRPQLPEALSVRIWRDDAEELKNRMRLLLKNGALGLFLVFVTLTLFLDLRLALRIASSIAITFVGALAFMNLFGVTINQMSLFGFILAVGIVVDAAIVTGENVFGQAERGRAGIPGTIAATTRIAPPVVFAVSTTIAAFLALIFIPGLMGQFMRDASSVVVIVLTVSLVTALLILPRHLSQVNWQRPAAVPGSAHIERARSRVARDLQRFTDTQLTRAVRLAIANPGITLCAAIGSVVLAVGLIANDLVRVTFFPTIESRYVTAEIELEEGVSAERTLALAEHLARIADDVADELQQRHRLEQPPVLGTLVSVGRSLMLPPPTGVTLQLVEGHKASVSVELTRPGQRPFTGIAFEQLWRERTGVIPEARVLRFSARMVNLGEPVQVELSARDQESLDEAVARLKAHLTQTDGVLEVRDDQDRGKRELRLRLTDSGHHLGLTVSDLARQSRAALFGEEALRVQRGRDEVRVYTRLDERDRADLGLLEHYRIKTPSGALVPLGEVAELSWGQTPSTLQRRNGRRIVTVSANIDLAITTGQQVNETLAQRFLPELAADLPGLLYDFGGEQREQGDVGSRLLRNFLLALFAIYVLIAIPFRSYVQPLIVMAAIPFGLVGAVVGHLLLRLDMTVLSMFGIVGLSGVVINGSLVMIDFINEEYDRGRTWSDAVLEGVRSRFRPVLLTAITTFLGVFPLILERDIQAQFLIPLAVSIGFGVLFGTAILMLVVPALAMLPGVRRPRERDADEELLEGHS